MLEATDAMLMMFPDFFANIYSSKIKYTVVILTGYKW